MSLVGSLEDLGLGDILQIISLSRKSGLLVLRSEGGEGQILFDAGLIRSASCKGGPTDLRELLAERGALAAEALEAAAEDARNRGCSLDVVLTGRGLLSAEAIDQERRGHVEAAVFEMFSWSAGEFSFEVRDVEDDGGGLFASPGINPQFLALEGTRRVDEGAHESEGEELAFGIVDDDPVDTSPTMAVPVETNEGPAIADPFAMAEPAPDAEPSDVLEVDPVPHAAPLGDAAGASELGEAEVAGNILEGADADTPPLEADADAGDFEAELEIDRPFAAASDVAVEAESAEVHELEVAEPDVAGSENAEPGSAETENAEPANALRPMADPVPQLAEPVADGPGPEAFHRVDDGPVAEAVAVVAEAVVEEVAPATSVLSEDDLVAPDPGGPLRSQEEPAAAPAATTEPPEDSAPMGPVRRPVVLIDPDLAALEWAKEALGSAFERVHIFQRTDLGIQRIRQYLARAEVPMVVLSVDAPPDPVSGARELMEMAARLRKQSPRITIAFWKNEEDELPQGGQALVPKPTPSQLADPRRAGDRQRIAEALVVELAQLAPTEGTATAPASGGDLKRLRETSARIREGASHGEVLPQVLAFAAQTFARVALFMIRDDRAIGIAQSGLPKAGGPDDEALRGVHLGCRESATFRKVLDTRKPSHGMPTDEGDQRLCVMLGNEIPDDLYVAPIESADRVVALLVGDNLPGREPIGDTEALEVLLDSAGIALDRALLERTLAENDG